MNEAHDRIDKVIKELMEEKHSVFVIMSSLMTSIAVVIESLDCSDEQREVLISGVFDERSEILVRTAIQKMAKARSEH